MRVYMIVFCFSLSCLLAAVTGGGAGCCCLTMIRACRYRITQKKRILKVLQMGTLIGGDFSRNGYAILL